MTSIGLVRICFCLKEVGLVQNSELISINTSWDLSKEHWWDLITFESILFLYNLIVCICLKYLVCPSKWRVELGVWEVLFFSVPEEILYCFFNFLCDIFWDSINVAYVSQWRIWFGLRLSYYLSKRVSLCSRYGFFCYSFTYFVPFGVIELAKLS